MSVGARRRRGYVALSVSWSGARASPGLCPADGQLTRRRTGRDVRIPKDCRAGGGCAGDIAERRVAGRRCGQGSRLRRRRARSGRGVQVSAAAGARIPFRRSIIGGIGCLVLRMPLVSVVRVRGRSSGGGWRRGSHRVLAVACRDDVHTQDSCDDSDHQGEQARGREERRRASAAGVFAVLRGHGAPPSSRASLYRLPTRFNEPLQGSVSRGATVGRSGRRRWWRRTSGPPRPRGRAPPRRTPARRRRAERK